MKVTSVRIKKVKKDEGSKVLGVASICLDNSLVIHGIKLLNLRDKRIISFPSKRIKKFGVGNSEYESIYEYTDIVHPITSELRDYLEEEVFKVYDEMGENNRYE